jgi:hypothetical protein
VRLEGASQDQSITKEGDKILSKELTRDVGAAVADNQNSVTAGPRRPMLLRDVWLLEKLAHFDREVIRERRMHAKGSGAFPRWRMKIQVVPEKDASGFPSNPFDLTKVWPHKDYPLVDVGVLKLNKNPENDFAEVEQSVFNPANIVPGMRSATSATAGGPRWPTARASPWRWAFRSARCRETSSLEAGRVGTGAASQSAGEAPADLEDQPTKEGRRWVPRDERSSA